MPARESSNQSTLDAGLDRMTIGDFATIERDYQAVREYDRQRTPEAQRADDSRRAPITTSSATWRSDPRRWDYPGVDTPTDSPAVLPKDHKAGGNPRIIRGGAESLGSTPFGPLGSEELARETTALELSNADVSLSVDEDLYGLHAYSERAIGGFRARYPRGGGREPPRETDRMDLEEQDPIPSSALESQARAMGQDDDPRDDITYIYEEEGVRETGWELHEFGSLVRSKKRRLSGVADDWAAARLVVKDLEEDL